MDRRSFLRTAAGGGVAIAAGCQGQGRPSADYDVGMTTVAFDPVKITIDAGEGVRWRNTSSHAHTVTAYESSLPDGAAFFATGDVETTEEARQAWFEDGGGALYSGEKYEHVFEVPGTYVYFCVPHEKSGMIGRITVEE